MMIRSFFFAAPLLVAGDNGIDPRYYADSEAWGDDAALQLLRKRLSGNASIPRYGSRQWLKQMDAYSPQGEQIPAYIIDCATEADVREAIIFAKSLNLPLTPRSGAHNLAELSNVQGGVVITQRLRTQVSHNTKGGTVTFEGGAQFQHVDAHLHESAPGWFMQSAMISTIGIAGSHNAVGVGWLQRKLGNGIDNVVALRAVMADGSLVVASKDEHPDLFYALRGAAPSYGIVTEMTERIHQIGDPSQGKEVRVGCFFFGLEHGDTLWETVSEMANDATFPDEGFILPLFNIFGGKSGITLWYLQYLFADGAIQENASSQWEGKVRRLVEATGAMALEPKGLEASQGDGWEYIDHMETQALFAPPWVASFYPSGGFVSDAKADVVFAKVLDHWRNEKQPDGAEDVPFHTTAFYHMGGHVQRSRKATAWPGNSETQWLTATWGGILRDQEPKLRTERRAQTKDWVDKMTRNIAEDIQFAYICGAAYNWRSVNFAKWIHGPSFNKLVDVKAVYDAEDIFRNNVNIPSKNIFKTDAHVEV